ncbi:glycoside hydrolase family 31 protein [Tomitella cavernea]|uniref:DUF5110 domain-containing protein n=1 Tax=Tomitella cavernea TaxID=1387982 RepID=A0ABP9CMS4_9ACTN|nr:glycoside hydrolase family 31 protein [Tomitella cavernea]
MEPIGRRGFLGYALAAAGAVGGADGLSAVGAGPAAAGGVPGAAGKGERIGTSIRVQVVSPTCVRLECARGGAFEDRGTMLGAHRAHDGAAYARADAPGRVTIDTGRIRLRIDPGAGTLDDAALGAQVLRGGEWIDVHPRWERPGYTAPIAGLGMAGYLGGGVPKTDGAPATQGNLGGWLRALDTQFGPVLLHDGLLSRDGWVFLDDSASQLIVDGHRVRRPPGDRQDGYLFGYGDEYPDAFADYRRVSGQPAFPPRAAFGLWFSRYHPYSDDDYRSRLLPAFADEEVPLSVLMVDTDYKSPHKWNGWNWRNELFPDPPGFLAWAHEQGLQVGLNVHPSIAAADPQYGPTVRRAGPLAPIAMPNLISLTSDPQAVIDQHFGFDWSVSAQLDAYLALHAPFEEDGADFWWLDWCCDGSTAGPPDGTSSGDAWINSRYGARSRDRGSRWPVLSRAGGSWQDWAGDRPGPWGEHRNTIHFTGDAVSSWEMLDFQTRFTVAEGNAGMPYVSHDVGGFQGPLDNALYARWVQAGAFSPVMRLHSGTPDRGDPRRLPWEFPQPARGIAAEFMRTRSALVPYLYTLGRRSADTGMPMARGMYLAWPGFEQAYRFDRQFMLGDDLLVAPVGVPGNPAVKRVWFPPGEWHDVFTGERHTGPAEADLRVPLDRMPVFARAGAVLPLHPAGRAPVAGGPLLLRGFAGADGRGSIYEDDSTPAAAAAGGASTDLVWSDGDRILAMGPRGGAAGGLPAERPLRVRIDGVPEPRAVTVSGAVASRVAASDDGPRAAAAGFAHGGPVDPGTWTFTPGPGGRGAVHVHAGTVQAGDGVAVGLA